MANLTIAQALAAFAGSTLAAGTRIVDTSRAVAENIDALQPLAASGLVAGIDLRNGGQPALVITAAQRTADAGVLALISGPFLLEQRITAAQAASATLDPAFRLFGVWDTAANIAANLPAIQALYRAGTLGLVRQQESGVQTYALTAAQVAANIDALRALGVPMNITLTDPGTPTLTLPVWATGIDNYVNVIGDISTPFNLAIAGPMRASVMASIMSGVDRFTAADSALPANPIAPLGGTSTATLPGGLDILDFQSRLSGYIASLQIAVQAGKIDTITTRDGGLQVLSLTAQQLTDNAAALAKFSPNIQLSQVISAAAAGSATLDARFANFTVEDSVANVMANIATIDALMRQGRLGRLRFTEATPNLSLTADQLGRAALILSAANEVTLVITLTNGGTPTVAIGGDVLSVAAVRSAVLAQVTGPYSLVVNGGLSASRAATIVSENTVVMASLSSVRISDFVSNLGNATNIAAAQTLAASGKLTGIDVLNSGVPSLGLSPAQIAANSAALALITTPVVPGTATGGAVSLTAAQFLTQLAALEAQVRAGTLTLINLVETDVVFTQNAATLQANIDAFGRLDTTNLLYDIELSDVGTPNFTLAPWQVTPGNLSVLAAITVPASFTITVSGTLSSFEAGSLGSSGLAARVSGTVNVADFTTNIPSNLAGLKTLRTAGKLAGIRLLDIGPPRFALTAAQISTNAGVLDAITSPHTLSVVVTAAAAAGTVLSGGVDSLTVSDTPGNIVANLPALQTLAVKGTLAAITGLTGVASLSAAQVAANAQALLRAGTTYTIALTGGGTPTITLQNWQIGTDIATLLNRITSPYTLVIEGAIRPNRAATLANAGNAVFDHIAAGSLLVREIPSNIRGSLPQLLTLANAGKIGSIDTRGGRPIFSLTAAEAVTYAPVLALVNTPYTRSLIISVAQIATATLPSGFTSFSVVDSTANILAGIAQVQALAVAGRLGRIDYTDAAPRLVTNAATLSASMAALGSQDIDGYPIVLTDPGTPTVTVGAHLLGDFDLRNYTLESITGPWSLQVTGRITADTVATIIAENGSVRSKLGNAVTVGSFSWDVQDNLDYLELLARDGHLAAIDMLDSGTPTITVTASQVTSDSQALAAITTPFVLASPTSTVAWAKTATLNNVTLKDFTPSMALDVRDLAFKAAGSSFTLTGNSLAIQRNGVTLGTATIAAPTGTTYSSTSFYVTPDGQGGTSIKASKAPISVTNTTTNSSFVTGGSFYSGAVDYLQREFINPTGGSIAAAANMPNVFLHGGGIKGNNALQAQSGRNVLDGGIGSNFLLGGTGDDTFFLDGRGGGVSWGTVVNFNKGDAVTFWGWKDGVTNFEWFASDGVGAFKGATIHARLAGGTGAYDASITFAGVDLATAQSFAFLTGTTGGANTYAYIASL